MKVFGYIRVSGKGQIEGHGFIRQEKAIRDYAEKNGITIEKIFREEGISGTLGEADRPAFQEMVSEILKNGIRTIIIEGLDRLARELRIQEQLLIFLASKGIALFSARTGEDVTAAIQDDPMKKAMIQIQGVFSELEKGLLVKKLRKARDAKREETGKCEGRKSYAEVSPALIKEIKRLRRPYGPRKGMTFKAIAAYLNSKPEFGTRTGCPWTPQNVQMAIR